MLTSAFLKSVFAAFFIMLSACTSMDIEVREEEKVIAYPPVPQLRAGVQTIKVKRLWARNVGAHSEQEFSKLIPALTEDAIYTVSEQGQVRAWRKNSPRKLWQQNLDQTVTGGIFVGYGLALVASDNGTVIALDSGTGEEKWRQELVAEILVPPQANGRIAVVQLANGMLHGLDFSTGEQRWSYKTTVPSLTLRGTSIPQIENQVVFTGFANGRVAAVDIVTGAAFWETNIYLPEGGTELEQVIDVDGGVLIDAALVYAASYQGRIAALSKQNGRAVWKNNASNFVGLEKGLNQIYSVEADGLVRAYRSDSGEMVWEQDLLRGRQLSAPAVQLNYLVLGDLEGYLYWMRLSDGEVTARKYLGRGSISSLHQWNFKGMRNKKENQTDFRIFSKPLVRDGVLYVQNQYGVLAAYQIIE